MILGGFGEKWLKEVGLCWLSGRTKEALGLKTWELTVAYDALRMNMSDNRRVILIFTL
jgi:hypothetical protein